MFAVGLSSESIHEMMVLKSSTQGQLVDCCGGFRSVPWHSGHRLSIKDSEHGVSKRRDPGIQS